MEAMESITKYFKEERDPLYRRGEAKGIAACKAEGERKKAAEIALEFKKLGVPIADISKGTGLSI